MQSSRLRPVLGMVLVAAVALALRTGTAAMSSGRGGASRPKPDGPRRVYRSPGYIQAFVGRLNSAGDSFLVAETGAGESGGLRLRRLTLPSAQTEGVPDLPRGRVLDGGQWIGQLSYAPDGSIAYIQGQGDDNLPRSSIWVRGPGASAWEQAVAPTKGSDHFLIGWSPDSTSLLYARYDYAPRPDAESWRPMVQRLSFAVVVRKGTGEGFEDKDIVPEASLSDYASWTADGQQVCYLRSARNLWVEASRVDVIAWPSQAAKTVFAAPLIGPLSSADGGGALFWAAWSGGMKTGTVRVWRMPAAGEPERTKLTLSRFPNQLLPSPDGRLLAVITDKAKLVVCNPTSGSKTSVAGLPQGPVHRVEWAMGGRALLALVGDKELWLVPMKGS